MIELVVFGLAGTTVHDGDAVRACLLAALESAGAHPDPSDVDALMGLPKPEAIGRLLGWRGPVEAVHEDFVRRMNTHYTKGMVAEIPGASAVFAELRRAGVKVGLNTGFGRAVSGVLLGRLGWHAPTVIDANVASDEVARGRPYPDMIRYLMARLGVADARWVAKVGDTRADLEEGSNAGCGLVIGVTTGSFTREQLLSHPHTHVVESVRDVPGVVLRWRGADASRPLPSPPAWPASPSTTPG